MNGVITVAILDYRVLVPGFRGFFLSEQMLVSFAIRHPSSAIISLAFYDTKLDAHSLQLNHTKHYLRSLRKDGKETGSFGYCMV